MQLFDEPFCQPFFCVVDDEVNATKVVDCFNYIIHIDRCIADADSVRLIDEAGLVVRQTTSFHVIGVICQVDLRAMIDAAFQPRSLLLL